jgi:protein AbiQ
MIPVPDNCLTQLKYNQVANFRSFSDEKEKTNYIYLLQKEKALIDNVQDTIQAKALKLYQKCIAKPDSSLAARCCDFKMLEEKCSSYSDT